MLSVQLGSGSGSMGFFGRLFFSLFCLAFFAMGLFFFSMIGRDVAGRCATYRWPLVPCVIRSSRVLTDDRSEKPYRLIVEYEYGFNGRDYVSRRAQLTDVRSGSYGEVLKLATKYPPESHANCYVNPKTPAEAVLQRSSLWYIFALAFPLPFMGFGAIGLVAVWRGRSASSLSK